MTNVPTIALADGVAIPQLGFGVFKVPPETTAGVVAEALRAGYRSIDTAMAYRNEQAVGEAIRASGIPREELFVTTKLWNADQGYDSALRAFEASLERLGMDYVDLYLIHWPCPRLDRYLDTWRAFERILADGRARAIGVSNFQADHLRRLLASASVPPALNQVELHPLLPQAELRAFHAEHGIVTEAWSPLARAEVLGNEAIGRIAAAHGRTPAQVVLRWHLQLGNVVIPKSASPARIAENLDVFGFSLGDDEMAAITALEDGTRTGPHPDEYDEVTW